MLSSAANALRVLEVLVKQGETGISDIARTLDLTVGTTFRLVTTLVDSGFAERNASTRRYRPGSKIYELARHLRGSQGFVSSANPHIDQLMQESGETVSLGVLKDDQVVYVGRASANQPLAVSVKIGSRVPAYCTSLGRAILAYSDPADLDSYLERLPQIAAEDTQKPPSPNQLRLMLEEVRRHGHSEDTAEFAADIACIGAPILSESGLAVAAVSVSGPQTRIDRRRTELIEMVMSTANDLSDLFQSLGEDTEL